MTSEAAERLKSIRRHRRLARLCASVADDGSCCPGHREAFVARYRGEELDRCVRWPIPRQPGRERCMASFDHLGTVSLCELPASGDWPAHDMPLCRLHLEWAHGRPELPAWFNDRCGRERRQGAEILRRAREGMRRDLARALCPGCGCGRGRLCVIVWAGGEGEASCAAAGDVPGHDRCSACVSIDQGSDMLRRVQ